jgi:hypothetical protein
MKKKVYSEVFFLSFPQWFLFDTNPCLLRLEPERKEGIICLIRFSNA